MEQDTYPISDNSSTELPSIFDDEKPLPLYYPLNWIYGLTIVFGALFGSILMAMNLNRNENRKGKIELIIFGILFTLLQLLLLNYIVHMNGGGFLFGLVAAQILKFYFWKNYIGNQQYTKRSIVKPVIIVVSICIFFLLFAFLGRNIPQ